MNDELNNIKIESLTKQVEVLAKELKVINEAVNRLIIQNSQLTSRVETLEGKLSAISAVSIML